MSVLISGVLINPAGEPIPDAEITFTALTTSNSVLNGFSASVMTNDEGEYSIPLEHCVYSISIQNAGYNSIYGSVSINEKSTPTTINELLKLATMEQAVTPAIIVYFREIQADVATKLVTMQTLSTKTAEAASAAAAARDEAAQYAQNLSAAVAQTQQASAAAAASANAASNSANGALVAKNAAETAAGNAQATLVGVMKKSANGADIDNPEQFRANLGLKDAVLRGEFGVGGILDLRGSGLLGPPKNIYSKGVIFGFCDAHEIGMGLPATYCSIKLDGSWTDVSGGAGICRTITVNGNQYSQFAISDEIWSPWLSDWSRADLPYPAYFSALGIQSNMNLIDPNSSALCAGTDSNGPGFYGVVSSTWALNDNYNMQVAAPYGSSTVSRLAVRTKNGDENTWNPWDHFTSAEAMGWGGTATPLPANTDIYQFFAGDTVSGAYSNHQGAGANVPPEGDGLGIFIWVRGLSTNYGALYYSAHNDVYFAVNRCSNGSWSGWHEQLNDSNTTVDANGFIKTASPVVKLFGTGVSELNAESGGVVTERIEQGVYRISGCLGLNSDLAWGGLEGGIVGPRCRNGLERLWIDYGVESDGSIVVRTYHRTHPSAM
ncbi:prophage tail fiber N-terminal domain-containing protein [Pectobacterium polonicum]|uniref:phage tail fiber protein n=1 Tax=Pectobacterium polonicum TaxID=2485124 RepID=UPI002B240D57|nr:prophage tail fiber N-terminal domain-containing protein [Pectobacterium polonicum]